MNSTSNFAQLIFAIEPFLLLFGGPILAVIITYFRRRSQSKADPQIRFDKSLLRAAVDTFGGIVIIWVILFFLFPIQNNQIRFAPQLNWLVENPIIGIGALIFIPILLLNLFLWYLIRGVKPLIYRGDYEAGLKFVRGLMWFPTMKHVLINMEGSIYQLAGRYQEAEACFRKVEERNATKKERGPRGSNLGSLGWTLMRQKRYTEALEVLQNSIEFYPEGADNFSGMGETLLWMGKPAEALPYLERGIENKRYRMKTDQFVWGELLANKAWALAQLGSFDQALSTYKQALTEAEQNMYPAMAGLHVRGAYLYRLMGDEAHAIGELNMALQLDPNGGYGQLAKEALEVPQERIGMAQLAIAATSEAVIAAIRHSTSPQRTIKVIRENLMLVAQGTDFSTIYLLRPQDDGTTVLQAVLEQTALVEAAVNNTDLKAGITVLMTNLKAKTNDNGYVTEHLKTISRAALQPISETTPADDSVPASYDAATGFVPKPLPSVTAKNRPSGGLNPSWYASMSFIMTPLLSSLALSYFWRRLGKPRWMWISIACTLIMPFIAIGGTLFLFKILPLSLQSLAILSGVGAWYGFSFALASVLEDPYKKWHQGGKEAIANYPYKWKRGVLIGLGVMVGASLLGMVVNVSHPGPQQLDHDLMSLTYPGSWTVGDINQLKSCTTDTECFAWLYKGRFANTNILFGRFSLSSTSTATRVERNTWNNLTRQNAKLSLETRDTMKISGLDAARRFYFYPPSDPKALTMHYEMQIYMVRGQYAYYVSVWSANKSTFQGDKADIDQILNTYLLKANPDDMPASPVRWVDPVQRFISGGV